MGNGLRQASGPVRANLPPVTCIFCCFRYSKTPTGKKRNKFLDGDDEEGKKEKKKSGKKKK